jgi:hypothetical protein
MSTPGSSDMRSEAPTFLSMSKFHCLNVMMEAVSNHSWWNIWLPGTVTWLCFLLPVESESSKPRPSESLHNAIYIGSPHSRKANCWVRYESIETSLWELHLGCMYLLPDRCESCKPRSSKSYDLHSFLSLQLSLC